MGHRACSPVVDSISALYQVSGQVSPAQSHKYMEAQALLIANVIIVTAHPNGWSLVIAQVRWHHDKVAVPSRAELEELCTWVLVIRDASSGKYVDEVKS